MSLFGKFPVIYCFCIFLRCRISSKKYGTITWLAKCLYCCSCHTVFSISLIQKALCIRLSTEVELAVAEKRPNRSAVNRAEPRVAPIRYLHTAATCWPSKAAWANESCPRVCKTTTSPPRDSCALGLLPREVSVDRLQQPPAVVKQLWARCGVPCRGGGDADRAGCWRSPAVSMEVHLAQQVRTQCIYSALHLIELSGLVKIQDSSLLCVTTTMEGLLSFRSCSFLLKNCKQ